MVLGNRSRRTENTIRTKLLSVHLTTRGESGEQDVWYYGLRQ